MFIAGWNLPGCLPDNPPAEFDDYDDAVAYLADELDRCEDFAAEGGQETLMNACAHAAAELDNRPAPDPSEAVVVSAGGYVFWVEHHG